MNAIPAMHEMKKAAPILTAIVLVAALVAALAAPATPADLPGLPAPRPLVPDDVYALKTVSDPRLSPDGKLVAYVVTTFDRKEDRSDADIYMSPLHGANAGEALRLTVSPKPENHPRWSPDGRYLAFLSGREGKKTQVWLLPRAGGEAFQLTQYKADVDELAWSPDGQRLALVVADVDPDDPDLADDPPTSGKPADRDKDKKDAPAKTPKPIVVKRRQFKRDGEGYLGEIRKHIHVFDLATRTSLQVTAGPYDDAHPEWSPNGQDLAFSSNRTADPDANQNTDIFLVAARAGATPRNLTADLPGSDSDPSFSPDGKWITFVMGGDPDDFWYGSTSVGVVSVNGTGALSLTRALDRNVEQPRFAADGKSVLFLVEEGGNHHLARVVLAAAGSPASAAPKIERLVDGERSLSAFDLDAQGRTGDIVALLSEPNLPGEVAFLTPGGSLSRLTHVNDAFLAGIRLGAVRRYQAKSPDGTTVDAFLTLPPGTPPGTPPPARLPTVLRIHGGPTAQYSTAWNLEWQMLAAHGYAVVAANPRGSTGYGRDFSRALWADWGNRDSQDVLAAVDQAIALGVADPDRLGVGGWSYGGILTDHLLVRTSRFKAAISGASEVNYLANYGTDHYQYEWEKELGLPWKNTALWMRLSPFFQIEKITTPTLLLCGEADANVPLLNSEQMFQALRRLGRDTELVIYPGQHHGIAKPSYIKDRYERYLAWYDKYLRPAGGGPVPAAAQP